MRWITACSQTRPKYAHTTENIKLFCFALKAKFFFYSLDSVENCELDLFARSRREKSERITGEKKRSKIFSVLCTVAVALVICISRPPRTQRKKIIYSYGIIYNIFEWYADPRKVWWRCGASVAYSLAIFAFSLSLSLTHSHSARYFWNNATFYLHRSICGWII